jgi:hypothetical protein
MSHKQKMDLQKLNLNTTSTFYDFKKKLVANNTDAMGRTTTQFGATNANSASLLSHTASGDVSRLNHSHSASYT